MLREVMLSDEKINNPLPKANNPDFLPDQNYKKVLSFELNDWY